MGRITKTDFVVALAVISIACGLYALWPVSPGEAGEAGDPPPATVQDSPAGPTVGVVVPQNAGKNLAWAVLRCAGGDRSACVGASGALASIEGSGADANMCATWEIGGQLRAHCVDVAPRGVVSE